MFGQDCIISLKKDNIKHAYIIDMHRSLMKRTERIWIFVNLLISFAGRCGPEKNCARAGRVRVQLVRVRGGCEYNLCGAGRVRTEYKFMCGFSQARGPAGRVRAWFRGPRRPLVQTMSSLQFTRHLVWAASWYRRCRHYNSHGMLCGRHHSTDDVVTTVYTTSHVGVTRVQTMSSLQFTRHVVRAASWYRRCRDHSLHDISCGRHQGTDDVVTTVHTTCCAGCFMVQTMSWPQFTRHLMWGSPGYRRCRDHSLYDISCGGHQGTDNVVTTVYTTSHVGVTRVQTMSSLQFTRHVVRAASWYRRCRHYSLHDI